MIAGRRLVMGAVVGAMLMLPMVAMGRDIVWPGPPVCPEPPVGYVYRWVPPVYRTAYDRVWVEERCERVLEWVEISPGRWEEQWTMVTIPGHWETTARRVLVSAGYWELVRIEPPPCYPPRPIPMPHPVVTSPATVGVDGYASRGGEDLRAFSPLTEWPEKK